MGGGASRDCGIVWQVDTVATGGPRTVASKMVRFATDPVLSSKVLTLALIDRLARRSPRSAALLKSWVRRGWWLVRRQRSGFSRAPTKNPEGAPGAPAPSARKIVPFEVEAHPDNEPLVSVVIPCFNRGAFIGQSVASVQAQTFKNLETIVVDGGSTDAAAGKIISSLEAPCLRVLVRGERRLAGGDRNYGIARARGKYICCLDADDKLHPTYVEKAVFLLEHDGLDVVGSAVQFFGDVEQRFDVAENVDLKILMEGNEVTSGAVFRKSLWAEAGGCRDHDDGSAATHLHEGWEFWMRLAAHGARFRNFPRDALYFRRRHRDAGLSERSGVWPIAEQRQVLRESNADIFTAAAVERSIRARETPRRAIDGLVNLRPHRSEPNPKSLILALPFMIIGGAERLLSRVMSHLAKMGWDIAIVTTIEPGPAMGDTTNWFEAATQSIFHLPVFLPEDRWPTFLDYLVVARRASRLLIAGSKAVYDMLPALKRDHPELMVVDLLFNTVGHTENNRRYAELIDKILVENAEVRDWLIEHGEQPGRVAVIPSGVDLQTPQRGARENEFSQQLGASALDLIVGFSGRWSEEKDPLGFIEIAKLLAKWPDVRFVMTGAGPLEDAITSALAGATELQGRFHILGALPDLGAALPFFDILVLPSRLDGRPLVVLEALASGVPVIASRVGGLPELIDPGQNGELHQPGEYEAFARSIRDLASNRPRLDEMKTNARRFAERRLDEKDMLDHYAKELARV